MPQTEAGGVGNLVNEDLEEFMETLFIESVWNTFSTEKGYKESYLNMCREVEFSKMADFALLDTVSLEIRGPLMELFCEVYSQTFGDNINRNHALEESVSFKGDKLRVKRSKWSICLID